MSTMTVALIVLICTVLFGGLMTSRSYLERFEDASGNPVPAPTAQATQAPLKVMPYTDIMAQPMQFQPMQLQPMQMQPPMMEPISLPFDAQILLPIQSPTFNQYRTTAAMQLQGAPYGQMAQMPQMAQVPQAPQITGGFSPEVMAQKNLLLDQAMQAATTGDMAAAASLKQAASQIGRG
jgi:hypothetical protein